MRHVIAIAVSLAAFAAFPAAAQHATQVSLPRVSLQGALVQGSLVVGKAAPGTRVQVDGIEVRVSTDGDFVLSFARNALPRYQLTLIPKQGLPETRTLEIRPRTWRVTKMKGLNVRRGKIPMNTGKGKTKPRKMTEAQRRAAAVRKVKIDREKRLIGKARGRTTNTPWFRKGFMWPAKGRISDVYGSQRQYGEVFGQPHLGLDIAAPVGTLVVAAGPGRVSLADNDLYFSGKGVFIDHGHYVTTMYVHLSKVLVKSGDLVRKGQPIGLIGSTGRSTGPHLHWGVIHWRTPVDPALLVGPMPR